MMITENTGFSSPRGDAFPAGLRVLVVDDDPTWLKILEKMLKKCSYEVTTSGLAREALNLLRERKDGFDIVISDVNMPDMDGFKLLEHVGLEMDLPVIMMSVDGETSRVMKGVQHGACDYLLKPIRMKELRNIWQHVFRKRIHEVRDIEFHEGFDEIHLMKNGSDLSEERRLHSGTDSFSGKKRKDAERHDDRECNDPSSVKKARVVWTVDLHQKFVNAVNQIGFDKVGPKKILDLMGVPWLMRENVASHLQKYRLYLGRLQKEKELTATFGGMKDSDISSKEPKGNHCHHDLVNKQQCDLASGSYNIHGNKNMMQNIDLKMHEADLKCTVPMPTEEPKKAINGESSDPQKSSSKKMSNNHSFGQFDSDLEFAAVIPKQYSWDDESLQAQFNREHKSCFQPKTGFNTLPLTYLPKDIQLDCAQPGSSPNSRPSSIDRDKLAEAETKPAYVKSRSQGIEQMSPAGCEVDLSSAQPGSKLTNNQAFKPAQNAVWSMNNHSLDEILEGGMESAERSLNSGSGTDYISWDENLHSGSIQGDFQPVSAGPQSIESLRYSEPELTTEVPTFLCDSLKIDFEYPFDSMEYPVIDQGLFIV